MKSQGRAKQHLYEAECLMALLEGEEAYEVERHIGGLLMAQAIEDIAAIRQLVEAWIKAQAKAKP